nr:cupin domain-containing protein [Luteibacter rhizovicinus]
MSPMLRGQPFLDHFSDDGRFPNHPDFPVLHYVAVIPDIDLDAHMVEAVFDICEWVPLWRGGVFDYHHYHSTAHEALGVASGTATLMLGGPGGRKVTVYKGDVLVLPAGTAHCCLKASDDFLVVGAYPPGQENYDILRGEADERPAALERIVNLPTPITDPVGGDDGYLMNLWVRPSAPTR